MRGFRNGKRPKMRTYIHLVRENKLMNELLEIASVDSDVVLSPRWKEKIAELEQLRANPIKVETR